MKPADRSVTVRGLTLNVSRRMPLTVGEMVADLAELATRPDASPSAIAARHGMRSLATHEYWRALETARGAENLCSAECRLCYFLRKGMV